MRINEITKIIVDVAFKLHTNLGPGLFESVYERIMEYELANVHGLYVRRQVAIPVTWKEIRLELGFRADLLVESSVIVEIKAIENIAPVHLKQLLTYLKLTDLKVGLLLNFDEELIKNGIRRVVNGL